MDRGLWGEVADLFADDGTLEVGIDGVYAGKARIREYLKRLHGNQEGLIYGQLNEWITLQPAVFVARDGRTATARWRDQGMLGQYKKHAEWRDGVYENTYVKQDGVWKLKSLHLYVTFTVPYEKGWGATQAGRGTHAERDVEGVSARPRSHGELQAVPRRPRSRRSRRRIPSPGKPVRGVK